MRGRDDDDKLGGKFWLTFIGILAAGILAGVIVFALFGAAWYAWGFLGAFLFLAVVLLAFAWISDRRQRNRRKELAA
jgi:membrane protein implicated in regulation of membrane protease activity